MLGAPDSARCASSEEDRYVTRRWARTEMTVPAIPDAAPISATTTAITNIALASVG